MKKVTTTIAHFSLPKENIDEFLNSWHQSQEVLIKQPGAIDGICYRAIDDDSSFQLVNVERWESPESLANALRFYAEEQKKEGGDWTNMMERLSVKVSQNNYVEEMKY